MKEFIKFYKNMLGNPGDLALLAVCLFGFITLLMAGKLSLGLLFAGVGGASFYLLLFKDVLRNSKINIIFLTPSQKFHLIHTPIFVGITSCLLCLISGWLEYRSNNFITYPVLFASSLAILSTLPVLNAKIKKWKTERK